MPNAVTHVLLTIVAIDIIRDYVLKKKFPRYFLLVGGIAGLFPDIDIPIGWLYDWLTGSHLDMHGGLTHSIGWPVLFGLLALVFYKHRNHFIFFAVVAFGWFFHIFLDCIFLGTYMPFLPLTTYSFCPHTFSLDIMPAIDAVILIAWLVHEEFRHKIRDYI